MTTVDIVSEEKRHLYDIRQKLLENPEDTGPSESEIVAQMVQLRDEINESKAEDLASLYMQMGHLNSLLEQLRLSRKTEQVDPDSPYFAHLRLMEDGKSRDVFLGRATRISHGLRIVDWRNAPISKLFYRYSENEEYEEDISGKLREGIIEARRVLHIKQGNLLRVGNSTETWIKRGNDWEKLSRDQTRLSGGEGSALRAGSPLTAKLGSGAHHRADKHLPDIAALIDPEQFELITASDSGVLVIRGSAGSGKTTVALHRIAYLCFEQPKRFRRDQVMFIVWGRAMRDYIAHVLPGLGVFGIKVFTWTAWARKMVKSHFPGLPTSVAQATPERVRQIKLHPNTEVLLKRHIESSPGPATFEQALEDWAHVLTDTVGLVQTLNESITSPAVQRTLRWLNDQTAGVQSWLDGEPDAEATLDVEDDALLLRAYQLRVGKLKQKGRPISLAHLAIDEVQDFSPIEIMILTDICDDKKCITLAGDTRQHISKSAGFSSWSEFMVQTGIETQALNTLEVSYRSTHPITRFALQLLDSDTEPAPKTTRDGPPVELFQFSDHGACVAFLAEELRQLRDSEPLANIALLTPSVEISQVYCQGLIDSDVDDVRQVVNQKFAFAPGIDIVEANEVKGLEFDYVVIIEASAFNYPDTSHYRRLLHVAATRAVHQLWLTSCATPSPILPKTMT